MVGTADINPAQWLKGSTVAGTAPTDAQTLARGKERANMAKRFRYYQPNKKDLKDQYGDCTIRALSKALECTWLDAFDMMIPICREAQCSNIFSAPAKVRNPLVESLGFKYTGVSNKKGTKRPTVDRFAKDHPEGTYILNVANHEVAVVDGLYYDTWDCGECSVYGYFEKEGI